MRVYVTDDFAFTEIIDELIEMLLNQGCATEGDFVQLYSIQYRAARDELNALLQANEYGGTVHLMGDTYSGIAVYGIYDPEIIDYADAKACLDMEGRRQEMECDNEIW